MAAESQKIVVFGAAGWVGRAVLTSLETHGHTIRASDFGPEAWKTYEEFDGSWSAGEVVHCDISDYDQVDAAIDGMDAIIHTAVLGSKGGGYGAGSDAPWLVNLKGLWNVLESARRRDCRRVVHMGSCQVEHPRGIFFTADVRRPDASLYAVGKRLQEELCRQFHEGHGLSIVVIRPASIVDSELGVSGHMTPSQDTVGNVCRHDLAEACHRALISDLELEILHAASHPDADRYCDMARTRQVLGMEFNRRIATTGG